MKNFSGEVLSTPSVAYVHSTLNAYIKLNIKYAAVITNIIDLGTTHIINNVDGFLDIFDPLCNRLPIPLVDLGRHLLKNRPPL